MNITTEELQLLLEHLADSLGTSTKEMMSKVGYASKDDVDKMLEDSKRYTDDYLVSRDEIQDMIDTTINARFQAAQG